MLKTAIRSALRNVGYEIRPIVSPDLKAQHRDVTDDEWRIYEAVRPYTMLSLERILANVRAVRHIVTAGIAGDIVECGAWRGGSAMALAMALGNRCRPIWLYDTFEGMTEPTREDGAEAAYLLSEARRFELRENSLVLAYASLADVRRNLEQTGYDDVRYIAGPVEKTIPEKIPEQIALLRLDTDWYESTKHELEHLYPRLAPGGILIIDDYGHWPGCRKAVDEYFGRSVFLHRIDYTGRMLVKPNQSALIG